MDPIDLEAELADVRAVLSGSPPPEQVWNPLMRMAWLLIALGRQDEGLAAAGEAQRARGAVPHHGALLWDASIAESAVHLANGEWALAEQAARKVLMDFDEEDNSAYLYELAVHAQGRLNPDRMFKTSKNPAEDLAAFDLRSYARQRLGLDHRA